MFKLLSFVGLFVAIFAFANADEVNYTDCGSKIGTVTTVKVNGCSTASARCVLKRNTNVTVEIDFTAGKDVSNVKAVVHGVILDVPVAFDIPNPNGCLDSGLECPLKAAGTYSYHATLPVLKKYPRLTLDVKWELRNEKDEDIACIVIPAKLG